MACRYGRQFLNLNNGKGLSWWRNICNLDVVVIDYTGQYSIKESYMVMMLENRKKPNGFWSKI